MYTYHTIAKKTSSTLNKYLPHVTTFNCVQKQIAGFLLMVANWHCHLPLTIRYDARVDY